MFLALVVAAVARARGSSPPANDWLGLGVRYRGLVTRPLSNGPSNGHKAADTRSVDSDSRCLEIELHQTVQASINRVLA